MKQKIYILLNAKGHQVVDFGNLQYDRDDDYPDFAIPLARAVATGAVERGVLLCGSGIGRPLLPIRLKGYARQSVTMIFQLDRAWRMTI